MTKTQTTREIAKLQSLVRKAHEIGSDVTMDYADYLLDRIVYLKLSINLGPSNAEWAGRDRHNANVEYLGKRVQKRALCEEQCFPGETVAVY